MMLWDGKDGLRPAGRRHGVHLALMSSVLLAVATAGPLRDARAQSSARNQRGDIVEKLLRSLIETELNKRDTLRTAKRTTPGTVRPGTQPTTPQLEKARLILDEVSREANNLTNTLNDEQRRNPSIRPYMSGVLKARARAAVLAQRSFRIADHQELMEDLKSLDRDWRVLSFRLLRIRNLSTAARGSITRINEQEKRLRDTFNVPPQLSRRELFEQTASLSSEFSRLLDDIEVELNRSAERTSLLLHGRKVQQQAHHVLNLVAERDSYDEIVSEYRRFQSLWYPFAARLRPLDNRYLERGVRRISHIDSKVHELLFLPQKLDRQRLMHLTGVLRKDVDSFFDRAPLKLLIDLPNSEQALPTADEFYGLCENFIDCVERGEDYDNLIGCFDYIEETWRSFDQLFRPLKSDSAHATPHIRFKTRSERNVAVRDWNVAGAHFFSDNRDIRSPVFEYSEYKGRPASRL